MKNVIITIFLMLLAPASCACGAELLVPSQYPTIQAAIDAAVDGDTVLVAPGTYTGPGNRDIDFLGKAITVRSQSGPNDCIIDCQQQARGFFFHNAEDANSIVDGFTITNGYAELGGGIYCNESSPKITNCTITVSSANYAGGGGIHCYDSNATITGCTITGNSANGAGGGIESVRSTLTIANSIVTDNNGSLGGGICLDTSSAAITDCVISRNISHSAGGGVFGAEGDLIITDSNISGNSAVEGGGICCAYEKTLTITNCIISGNSASQGGGGLMECTGHITNCTITANSASYGGGLYKCDCVVSNCIIWDNSPQQIIDTYNTTSVIYSDVQGGYSGLGNIDADPCFVEPGYWIDANDPNIIVEPNDPNAVWLDGDYHLLPSSPCINAGDPNYVSEPNETDLDGLPRVIGGRIDMGAYEFNHQPVAVAGPNQTAYAWIDGFADVNLDGSASFDDDNDILDYYWSWTIDGNTYEANDIAPTIKLPVGNHTIELVVDDGIDLSESDYCTITIIRAVRGRLMLSPRVLETKCRGRWILAALFIPPVPGEKVNTNELLCLYPGGIEAKYQRFYRYGRPGHSYTIAFALFDKQLVSDALGPGRFKVSVVGEFMSGRFFFGSDTIRIIVPRPPRPKPPYCRH